MSENASSEGHEPTPETRQRVRQLAKVKTSKERIAKDLGIGIRLFERHYTEDVDAGRDEAQSALLAKLLAQGLAGNANAAVKYMMVMGMAAPRQVVHTGPGGGPIQHIDLTLFDEDQLQLYGRLSAIAEGRNPDEVIVEIVGGDPPQS